MVSLSSLSATSLKQAFNANIAFSLIKSYRKIIIKDRKNIAGTKNFNSIIIKENVNLYLPLDHEQQKICYQKIVETAYKKVSEYE